MANVSPDIAPTLFTKKLLENLETLGNAFSISAVSANDAAKAFQEFGKAVRSTEEYTLGKGTIYFEGSNDMITCPKCGSDKLVNSKTKDQSYQVCQKCRFFSNGDSNNWSNESSNVKNNSVKQVARKLNLDD